MSHAVIHIATGEEVQGGFASESQAYHWLRASGIHRDAIDLDRDIGQYVVEQSETEEEALVPFTHEELRYLMDCLPYNDPFAKDLVTRLSAIDSTLMYRERTEAMVVAQHLDYLIDAIRVHAKNLPIYPGRSRQLIEVLTAQNDGSQALADLTKELYETCQSLCKNLPALVDQIIYSKSPKARALAAWWDAQKDAKTVV